MEIIFFLLSVWTAPYWRLILDLMFLFLCFSDHARKKLRCFVAKGAYRTIKSEFTLSSQILGKLVSK